jgi:hypothetical protein
MEVRSGKMEEVGRLPWDSRVFWAEAKHLRLQ